MKQILYALIPFCILVSTVGCTVCDSPYDCAYPTYGGQWQRVDRFHGRVGSVFTPEAGHRVGSLAPEEAVDTIEEIEGVPVEPDEPGDTDPGATDPGDSDSDQPGESELDVYLR